MRLPDLQQMRFANAGRTHQNDGGLRPRGPSMQKIIGGAVIFAEQKIIMGIIGLRRKLKNQLRHYGSRI
jgi:hypothetical protein